MDQKLNETASRCKINIKLGLTAEVDCHPL